MTNELAVREDRRFENPEMLRTLRETVCKGATESQFKMFIEICVGTKLNPFLKEIWFVPNVGVIAGRDGYLRIANEHPQFDGMETLVERDAKNLPIKATCRVWRKDRNHPITCEAYFNEYRKSGNVWSTYPSAMIMKVAEIMALKRSFSINGVVTEEEIGTEEERGSHEAQAEVAQAKLARMKAPKVQDEPPPPPPDYIDVVPEPESDPEPDKFRALAQFRFLKEQIIKETGDDLLYYEALVRSGYEKSNQIPADRMRKVYREIAKAFTGWKADQPMPENAA